MGRAPCCEKVGLKKGRWTQEEDDNLSKYIEANGEGSWRSLPKNAGLLRCGKSCRLRWINYLRNDLKRGNISSQEDDIIIKLHASLGNKWSLIASQLTGRTDNEIKNYWNSHLSRKIGTFRRPYGEPLPAIILNNLVNTSAKKKSGRTSRAAMKKNKHNYTAKEVGKFISPPAYKNVKESDNTNVENSFNVVPTLLSSTPTLEKETLPSAIISSWDNGGDEKTKKHDIIVPRSSIHPSSVVQERMMVNSTSNENKVVTNNNGIINDTTSFPLYGPNGPHDHHHQGQESDLMSFHGSYGQQLTNAMGGEDEINVNWEWDGFIHQNEHDQENNEMLSWLWQNDYTNMNSGYQEEITQSSEKQEAFVAWLLS